jgi:hypothetical protein
MAAHRAMWPELIDNVKAPDSGNYGEAVKRPSQSEVGRLYRAFACANSTNFVGNLL